MMQDVIAWLDSQIEQSLIHPDIKRHFLWVVENCGIIDRDNLIKPLEIDNKTGCPECGAKRNFHYKTCSQYKPRVKK